MMDKTALEIWKEQEFLPWKKQATAALDAKAAAREKLLGNMEALQTLLGMVMDGKTRQAVLLWNTLGLEPRVREIQLSDDREKIRFVTDGGDVRVVTLDELVSGLQEMVGAV